jgi:hypothetical protein
MGLRAKPVKSRRNPSICGCELPEEPHCFFQSRMGRHNCVCYVPIHNLLQGSLKCGRLIFSHNIGSYSSGDGDHIGVERHGDGAADRDAERLVMAELIHNHSGNCVGDLE